MKLFAIVLIVVVVEVFNVAALYRNSFDAIRGCKQFENVGSYDSTLPYFPTSSLLNVGHTAYSKFFKVAALGANDGMIRFGESLYPYDKYVIEIILGGWKNTKSVGQHQYRNNSNEYSVSELAAVKTPNLMSQFKPTMFVLELFHNGTFQVRIDGHNHPFLTFHDNKRIPANYMAFTKWDNEVIFFYDCPLEEAKVVYNS